MDEMLTIEEMERRYPGEWVVVTDVREDRDPEEPDLVIRRARVYWHGPTREEADAKADELPPPRHFGVWFLGPLVPEGMGIML